MWKKLDEDEVYEDLKFMKDLKFLSGKMSDLSEI